MLMLSYSVATCWVSRGVPSFLMILRFRSNLKFLISVLCLHKWFYGAVAVISKDESGVVVLRYAGL